MEEGKQPETTAMPPVVAKAAEKPAIYSLPVTSGIRPTTYEQLASFAKLYLESGLAPKSFGTWQQVMVAAAMCLEVGRPIATGIQDMAVINGRVGIFGDAALAVIRGSGLLETFFEWSVGTPFKDDWTFFCKVRRKGDPPCAHNCAAHECKDPLHCSCVGYFTWEEAKRAGFDDPKMRSGEKDPYSPWRRFTRRMMQFKARNFPLRDRFGDILKGIHTVEELHDADDETLVNVTPVKTTPIAEKKAVATYEIQKESPLPEPPQPPPPGEESAAAGEGGEAEEPRPPAQPAEQVRQPEVIPPANGQETPEEPPLYKVLKTTRPGKGPQAKADFIKLVKDNIEEIEKWPAMYKDHIKAKWDAKVSDPWPTFTAERPPEVPPEAEKPKQDPPKTEPERSGFGEFGIEVEGAENAEPVTQEAELPGDYAQLVAYLNGPVIVAETAAERLVSLTRLDAYITKLMGDTETDMPIDVKTFQAFLKTLLDQAKGKYKDIGGMKVSIWKQDKADLLWGAYLEWMMNARK